MVWVAVWANVSQTHLVTLHHEGDQIGRIFASLTIFPFGNFTISKIGHIFGHFLNYA
jgi:hypothetical protein